MSSEKNQPNTGIRTVTTKTINYPVEAFKRMIAEKCFNGKDIKVIFKIQEVGGDLLDRFPGTKQVVSVDIVEEI